MTGPIEYPNGDRYVGEYKVDMDKKEILHGKGEYVSKGFKYTGEFRDNKKQGKGVYIWSDGARFTGDFADAAAFVGGIDRAFNQTADQPPLVDQVIRGQLVADPSLLLLDGRRRLAPGVAKLHDDERLHEQRLA